MELLPCRETMPPPPPLARMHAGSPPELEECEDLRLVLWLLAVPVPPLQVALVPMEEVARPAPLTRPVPLLPTEVLLEPEVLPPRRWCRRVSPLHMLPPLALLVGQMWMEWWEAESESASMDEPPPLWSPPLPLRPEDGWPLRPRLKLCTKNLIIMK